MQVTNDSGTVLTTLLDVYGNLQQTGEGKLGGEFSTTYEGFLFVDGKQLYFRRHWSNSDLPIQVYESVGSPKASYEVKTWGEKIPTKVDEYGYLLYTRAFTLIAVN